MHNLLRYYNQNRIKVWTIILAIIFGLVIIQVLNSIAKENNEKKQENIANQETTANVVSYDEQSKSIITGGSVTQGFKDEFGKILDEFFTNCVNHEPEKAYEMLSNDCKNLLYTNEKTFEDLYYSSKFEGNKSYSFQSWSRSGTIYVYQVKIFDNMLSTGKSNDTYIEDFVTILKENNEYKINVNSYICKQLINKTFENDNVAINVKYADSYIDYTTYTVLVKNKTDKRLVLDTRTKTNSTYIVDSNGNKFESFLYENEDLDLVFDKQEFKEILIKFNVANRDNLQIKSINFTDLTLDNEKIDNVQVDIEV